MSKRAERLADYLEQELDWNIYPSSRICPKCDKHGWDKYCEVDGSKLIPNPERKNPSVVEKLEAAIAYALKEKNTKTYKWSKPK